MTEGRKRVVSRTHPPRASDASEKSSHSHQEKLIDDSLTTIKEDYINLSPAPGHTLLPSTALVNPSKQNTSSWQADLAEAVASAVVTAAGAAAWEWRFIYVTRNDNDLVTNEKMSHADYILLNLSLGGCLSAGSFAARFLENNFIRRESFRSALTESFKTAVLVFAPAALWQWVSDVAVAHGTGSQFEYCATVDASSRTIALKQIGVALGVYEATNLITTGLPTLIMAKMAGRKFTFKTDAEDNSFSTTNFARATLTAGFADTAFFVSGIAAVANHVPLDSWMNVAYSLITGLGSLGPDLGILLLSQSCFSYLNDIGLEERARRAANGTPRPPARVEEIDDDYVPLPAPPVVTPAVTPTTTSSTVSTTGFFSSFCRSIRGWCGTRPSRDDATAAPTAQV